MFSCSRHLKGSEDGPFRNILIAFWNPVCSTQIVGGAQRDDVTRYRCFPFVPVELGTCPGRLRIQYTNLKKYEQDGLPCDGFNCDCFRADCGCGYEGGNLEHIVFQWCPTTKVNIAQTTYNIYSRRRKTAKQGSKPDKPGSQADKRSKKVFKDAKRKEADTDRCINTLIRNAKRRKAWKKQKYTWVSTGTTFMGYPVRQPARREPRRKDPDYESSDETSDWLENGNLDEENEEQDEEEDRDEEQS